MKRKPAKGGFRFPPFANPLKTAKKGAAAPFLGFSSGLGLCGSFFKLTKRDTDASVLNRRGHRNTLRLFRLWLERQSVCGRYAMQPLQKDDLSTSIRQIFNGREQSDLHGLSCARETRFYGRPKGVLTTETERQNAQNNELIYQARQRYFASPAPLFSPFFSGKTEKNGPAEQTPRHSGAKGT